MITFRVPVGTVRWALSPIHEVVSLARLLTEPDRHEGYREWIRRRHHLWDGLGLTPLTRFMADGAYRPDFVEPPPLHPRFTFDDGYRAALTTPLDVVRAELDSATAGWAPAAVRDALADSDRTRAEALAVVGRLWADVLEAEWPAIRATLADELAERAFDVLEFGLARTVGQLHPSLTVEGDAVRVAAGPDMTVDVGSLVLVPSLFISDRVQCTTSTHWGGAIYYPCTERYLWRSPLVTARLVAALGSTRARCLAATSDPGTTRGIADRLGVAPSTASEHLSVLRSLGWVSTSRVGHTVVHRLTGLGSAVVSAALVDVTGGGSAPAGSPRL